MSSILIIFILLFLLLFYYDNSQNKEGITYGAGKIINIKNYKQSVYALILKKTQKALDKLNISFFLSSGTCLGYLREGKFIDHDYDIDIGIFERDYNEKIIDEMKKEGLVLYRTFGTPKDGLELSFKLPGTRLGKYAKIDIFLHYYEKDKIYWVTYSPQKDGGKKIKYMVDAFNLKKVRFMGVDVNVPYPTQKYIENHYGNEWMIPKKFNEYKYYNSPISIVK